ncbi:uncharacterized protein LOC143252267 [Tachypleus tridentatus]|uniref:uncharacterized protein LOC143252267 n=1 Tax=Tachypleus tridentatus TaxID=6853 RepID=UPI003FCF537B
MHSVHARTESLLPIKTPNRLQIYILRYQRYKNPEIMNFFIQIALFLMQFVTTRSVRVQNATFNLVLRNSSLSEESRMDQRTIKSPVACAQLCLTNPHCEAFSLGPPLMSPTSCETFSFGINSTLEEVPGWNLYTVYEPKMQSFTYKVVDQNFVTQLIDGNWKLSCGQNVLVGLWDNTAAKVDFDFLKCMNTNDTALQQGNKKIEVDVSETNECPRNSVISALISTSNYMVNVVRLECSLVGPGWLVNTFDCLTIIRTKNEAEGPKTAYEKWKFECLQTGEKVMAVVSFISDQTLTIKCCSLIQVKP